MTKPLFGELSAYPQSSQARTDLIALINERVQPPAPLRLEDIHIRAMRLVSDQVNDHGGRFPIEEHQRLCELLVDSPVMIGHDHSQLPVARNFAARCVDEGKRSWVEVWFYWMRGVGPHHDRLAADIDAGVVKEGSIGFEFGLPQCSICGADVRACEHIPGIGYDGKTAYYEYRNIMRVLETSLVYRGATPNTRIVKYPLFSKLSSLTRPLRGRPLPEGEANKLFILSTNRSETAGGIDSVKRAVCSPLPLGEVVQSKTGRVRETATADTAPPTLLRVFLTSCPELRSYHCPARTVPWPRFVHLPCEALAKQDEYKAGHGPPALRSLGAAGQARSGRGRLIR